MRSKQSFPNEFDLIARISSHQRRDLPEGFLGIGDDCALLPGSLLPGGTQGGFLAVSTDLMLEGRHFDLNFSSFFDVGWKSVTSSLSDLAAMGAIPQAVLVQLVLSPAVGPDSVDKIYAGISSALDKFGASLIGGDTVSGDRLMLGLTVIGTVDQPVLRTGAQIGDDLWLTGAVGFAGLGLELLKGEGSHVAEEIHERAITAHRRPECYPDLVTHFKDRKMLHSMIDISDGLLQDACHVARGSGQILCLEIDTVELPRVGTETNERWLPGLASGDDYQLLFSVSSEHREEILDLFKGDSRFSLRRIGSVLEPDEIGPRVIVATGAELLELSDFTARIGVMPSGGFQHFQAEEE